MLFRPIFCVGRIMSAALNSLNQVRLSPSIDKLSNDKRYPHHRLSLSIHSLWSSYKKKSIFFSVGYFAFFWQNLNYMRVKITHACCQNLLLTWKINKMIRTQISTNTKFILHYGTNKCFLAWLPQVLKTKHRFIFHSIQWLKKKSMIKVSTWKHSFISSIKLCDISHIFTYRIIFNFYCLVSVRKELDNGHTFRLVLL